MSWTPRYRHVTQLEDWHDGCGLHGHLNCAEASLARYLRESGYPFSGPDNGQSGSLIAWLREKLTGQENSENNIVTYTSQITAFLDSLGFDGSWTSNPSRYNYSGAACLLLLAAADLSPAQYPYSWLNTHAVDHYILRLVNGVYNDPLAFDSGKGVPAGDCDYQDNSVLKALAYNPTYNAGGWVNVLPDPHTVTWSHGKAVLPPTLPALPPEDQPGEGFPSVSLPFQGPQPH